MNTELQGKTALVTGGTSGIGLAIAKALVAEGVQVAVASRDWAVEVIDELNDGQTNRAIGIRADVSHEDEVASMVAEAIGQLGCIDLFVNNAAQARHQPITKLDTETYRKVLDTNLSAALWGCRDVARHMIGRHGGGSILVAGSTSMYTPGPTEAVYRITKFGLKSLVQSLAIELAPHGIRVNLLVPGHYRTRLTQGIPQEIERQLTQRIPLRRFGATSDCGKAAAFLLSDALSGYTTGAELVVDGGLALRPLFFGDDADLRKMNEQD